MRRAIDDRGIDHGPAAGLARAQDPGQDADDEIERASADIADQRRRGDRRFARAEAYQRAPATPI